MYDQALVTLVLTCGLVAGAHIQGLDLTSPTHPPRSSINRHHHRPRIVIRKRIREAQAFLLFARSGATICGCKFRVDATHFRCRVTSCARFSIAKARACSDGGQTTLDKRQWYGKPCFPRATHSVSGGASSLWFYHLGGGRIVISKPDLQAGQLGSV
jgi:hypothetical protein